MAWLRVYGICAVLALPALQPASAGAVILYPTPMRNGEPAADSIAYQPWQYEGKFGAFLGTPIAPQYFLAAAHVGGGSTSTFTFNGATYAVDPTFGNGGHITIAGSDINVWKVSGTFPVYAPLYTSNNEFGKHIVVIGRGTQRGAEVRVAGRLKGWQWGDADGMQSWGENDVSGIVSLGNAGDGLQFNFNPGTLPNECSLSTYDSSGGVFILDNGAWKLAGLNYGADGPFSTSSSGANPFYASLFEKDGLYESGATGGYAAASEPGSSYASRISTRAQSIYSIAPGCPVVQATYSVQANADMGTVYVQKTTTVGSTSGPVTLKATYVRTGTLAINDNAVVRINPNGTAGAVSSVTSLKMASTATLDLYDNDLIVRAPAGGGSSALSQVVGLITSARNSGKGQWQGYGITTSAAPADSPKGLAVLLNDRGNGTPFLTSFDGQSVDANSVLVKFTWNGDTDLNGRIDSDDYFRIDRGLMKGLSGYSNGDFDYNGRIDADDYHLIDDAFTASRALSAAAPTQLPEPGVATFFVIISLGLLRRRIS